MRSNYQPRRKGNELFFYCFIITINQTKRVENVGKRGEERERGKEKGGILWKKGVVVFRDKKGC